MGGSCSICHQPTKYNPIVENKPDSELEQNSLKKPKPPESLFSNTTGGASIDNSKGTTVKPNNVEYRLSNFSESDYTHYLKLQKAMLLKNIMNVKKSMFILNNFYFTLLKSKTVFFTFDNKLCFGFFVN